VSEEKSWKGRNSRRKYLKSLAVQRKKAEGEEAVWRRISSLSKHHRVVKGQAASVKSEVKKNIPFLNKLGFEDLSSRSVQV